MAILDKSGRGRVQRKVQMMFILRKKNPYIGVWWNADRMSRDGLSFHRYLVNGYFLKSYRMGALVIDVFRPTRFLSDR